MKRSYIKLISMFFLCSVFIFSSCYKEEDDDKGDDGDDIEDVLKTDTIKVTYIATVSDTLNYLIRVLYVGDNGSVNEDTVKSPFVHKFNAQYAEYVYLSVMEVPLNKNYKGESTVSCKIYENEVLYEEIGGDFYANVSRLCGVKGN